MHMIDLKSETKLSLSQAAAQVPSTRQNKQVHVSTIVRWILRGVCGVRLEAVRVGGRWVTTHEALERFSVALTAQYISPPSPIGTSGRQDASHRQRQQDRVEEQLAALGI